MAEWSEALPLALGRVRILWGAYKKATSDLRLGGEFRQVRFTPPLTSFSLALILQKK